MEKYNEKHEQQLRELGLDRIKTGNYQVFNKDARVITRTDIEGIGRCLVITNGEGETVLIDAHFELVLAHALEKHDRI